MHFPVEPLALFGRERQGFCAPPPSPAMLNFLPRFSRGCFALSAGFLPIGAEGSAADAIADSADWGDAMKKVHAKFSGKPGTFAQLGDSITVTMAFWAPLEHGGKNFNPSTAQAVKTVKAYMDPRCWRQWKGPEYGSEGGKTVGWALEHLDGWLEKMNPEVALVMFGTNDLTQIETERYEKDLRRLVEQCLERGTVVILSTIPPRSGMAKAAEFAEAARKVARELKVPLVDYHAEILKRRPEDWDGSLPKFEGAKNVYDVTTLISRDGVHPSSPRTFGNDYSPEGLRSSGYNLRNDLTVRAYATVIEKALRAEK